nr:hypothetical protein BH720_24005 [Desertifilum tharense IPPAS B-1220]
MRSLSSPEPEPETAPAALEVTPTPQLPTPSIQPKESAIQRQCTDCAEEQQEQSENDEKSFDEIASIQTKLTIGAPGDQYEQEADKMAAQVMSMSVTPQVQRLPETENPVQMRSLAQSITPVIHRQVDEQVQMQQLVQRAFQPTQTQASGDLESRLTGSKGSGSPLSQEVRSFMEPRFGADFSQVRVHTGNEAVQMNRELGAQAFTHGSDVYFGEGKSPGNNELTAHELTHVVQQSGQSLAPLQRHDLTGSLFTLSRPNTISLPTVQCDDNDTDADDIDQVRADREILSRPLYHFYGTAGLVDVAVALDAELMSDTLGSRMTTERARTLLAIYHTLQHRLQSPEARIDEHGLPQPLGSPYRLEGEQQLDELNWETSSPLAGILEDMAPFGNVDLWTMLANATPVAPRRRQPARRQDDSDPIPPPIPPGEVTASEFSAEDHGGREADSATARIREEVRLPEPSSSEPNSADVLDLTISIMTEIVEIGLAELTIPISAVLNIASVVGTMDQTEQSRRADARATGVRLAVLALGLIHPPPRLLSLAILEEYCSGTAMWTLKIHENHYPLGQQETEAAMRSGLRQVASLINEAVKRSERRASIDIQRPLIQSEAQQLREVVYERIQANLRSRIN